MHSKAVPLHRQTKEEEKMTFEEKIQIGVAVADAAERAQEEQLKKIEESADIINKLDSLEVRYGYSYVSDFEYGLARIRKGSKWGLINKDGKVVLPIQYDAIWKFEGKHRATTNVELNGKIEEIRLCEYSDEAPEPYWEKPRYFPRDRHYDPYPYCGSDCEDEYAGTYAHDVAGFSDEDIDTIFDGEPDAYWNID